MPSHDPSPSQPLREIRAQLLATLAYIDAEIERTEARPTVTEDQAIEALSQKFPYLEWEWVRGKDEQTFVGAICGDGLVRVVFQDGCVFASINGSSEQDFFDFDAALNWLDKIQSALGRPSDLEKLRGSLPSIPRHFTPIDYPALPENCECWIIIWTESGWQILKGFWNGAFISTKGKSWTSGLAFLAPIDSYEESELRDLLNLS